MSTQKKQKSATSTGFLLWQAGNAWQRSIKTALDPVGLTHVQFLLLDSLEQLGGQKHPVTQVKLARHAGTDVMMTSKVVRLLESKKLVGRKPNRSDGRALLLELTKDGSRKLAKARGLVKKSDGRFFSKLTKQQGKFVECLITISGA